MTTSGDSATSSPQQLFDAATALAEENNLWEAALTLMQGFEELGDKADAPQTDSLGRPIRGSAPKLMDKAAFLDFVVEIVRRSDPTGFHVLPRRWVVERTFGWMIRWRRLVRDYERRLDVSEAMIHVAMGALLLRRVAHR